MITDINGKPYTSVKEDMLLEKLREGLRQMFTQMVKQLITKESDVDASPLIEFLSIVYALGRLESNPEPKPVTNTERQRLHEKVLDFLRVLQTAARNAQSSVSVSTIGAECVLRIDLHEANEHMRQIYYMGREDGAR